MALQLFISHGRLKQQYRDHPVKKGSGVWRDEFDSDGLLLVEDITVDHFYKRRSLAAKLAKSVMDKCVSEFEGFDAIVFPLSHFAEVGEEEAWDNRFTKSNLKTVCLVSSRLLLYNSG